MTLLSVLYGHSTPRMREGKPNRFGMVAAVRDCYKALVDPGLYIVGTPIGNLADLSPRAVDTLRGADAVFAEDTRITQRLLARYELRVPLVSCHKFNEASRVERLLDRLRAGQRIAVVTDSGMPGVSDPGARILDAARRAGFPVFVIPGPSAVTAAAALCGFAGGGFHFAGFLPVKKGGRHRALDRLLAMDVPVILFESPYRLLKLLAELEERAPDRQLYVGRELTKLFEESRWGTASDILAAYGNRTVKGELVVALAPADGPRHRAADEETPPEGDQ